MKNTFNRFLCFVFILGIFSFCGTFISCENLFGAKEKAIQEKAYITITTNLSSNVRTVFPSEFTEDTTGLTWTLTGIPSGGEEQELGEWSDPPSVTEADTTTAYKRMKNDSSITLNAGTWTFTLTAKNNSGKVLEATITKTITGGKNTLVFDMKEAVGKGAASGQIEFTLQWEELGVVNNVVTTLSKRNDSSFSDIISDLSPLKSDDNKYEYVFYSAGADSTLTPGNYILKLELQQQTDTPINTYTCLIHVAPGLCSEGEAKLDTLAPLYTINYLEEDEIKITSFEENSVPTTYNEYTTFALPTPTKVGHIFSGWYEKPDNGTFVKIENTDNFRISKNTNLYAKWNLIETWEDITRAVNCVSDELPSQPEFIVTNNLTATRTITISGGITLKALDGANGVTITRGLDNSGTAFKGAFFDNQSTLTLEGITLDGGKNSNIEATAPLITSSKTLTLKNCTLQNNKNTSTTEKGGAINISAGTFTMNGGVIGSKVTENETTKQSWQDAANASSYSNYAEAGGGGIYVANGTVTIEDATISYNYTLDEDKNNIAHGGGIYIASGNLTLEDTEVSYNRGYQGAGVKCYSENDNAGTVTLKHATIKGNASKFSPWHNFGGGVVIKNFTLNCDTSTEASIIEENYSGDGGALFLEDTNSILQNITIQNNSYNEKGYKNGSEVLLYSGANVSISSSDVTIKSVDGETRGIFINYDDKKTNTLDLSRDAKLDAPIYLTNGAKVTVSKELTSTDTVATITPEQYTVGTQVVNASEGVNIEGRFAVTSKINEDGTATTYTIDSAGFLAKASSTDTETGEIESSITVASWQELCEAVTNANTNTQYSEDSPYTIAITRNFATEVGSETEPSAIEVYSHIKLIALEDSQITRTAEYIEKNLFIVQSDASLTIGDANATGILTLDGGGGSATPVNATRSLINVSSNGTLILNEKSVLQNNKCPEKFSTNGAAVYSKQGKIKICGGTVRNNSNAYSGNYGGGIYLTDGTFIMTSGNFEENSSYKLGGALYIEDSDVSISGGQFISNSLTGSETPQEGYCGSAVYFSSITTEEAISNLTVKNNQNAGSGTLYITGSGKDTASISICDCTFEDNSAYQRGGAICTAGTSYVDITSSSFINNKVMSDTAHGGAIYVANTYGSFKVNVCNFTNNTNTNTLDTIYYYSTSDVVVTVDETQLSANVVWNPS